MSITNEQVISGIYIAIFNRAPDKNSLDFWSEKATSTTPSDAFQELAASLVSHPSFITTFGGLSNQQFIEAICKKILGFEGEVKCLHFWTDTIEKTASRSKIVTKFIINTLNLDLSDTKFDSLSAQEKEIVQQRKNTLLNKIDMALYFITSFGEATNITHPDHLDSDPAYIASTEILSKIDHTSASLKAAQSTVSLNGENIQISNKLDIFITSFDSTSSNKTYFVGDSITITATTNTKVKAGSSISVTLNTKSTVLLSAPVNGSSLVGRYTVSSGDRANKLTVNSFTVGLVKGFKGSIMHLTNMPAINISNKKAIAIDGGTYGYYNRRKTVYS